jgi:hypothetical protein
MAVIVPEYIPMPQEKVNVPGLGMVNLTCVCPVTGNTWEMFRLGIAKIELHE